MFQTAYRSRRAAQLPPGRCVLSYVDRLAPLVAFAWLAPALAAQQAAATPRIQNYVPSVRASVSASRPRQEQNATLHINAAATTWTDTGLLIDGGDSLAFSATGSIALAGHTLSPDGMQRGWKDMLRHFPVDSANAGALVGRIGGDAAVPFTIGEHASVEAMQAGTLYLRINSSEELPAAGSVTVELHVTPPTAPGKSASNTGGPPLSAIPLSVLDKLPPRVADSNGTPGDAVNFVLLGTAEQVRDDLARAGWVAVDSDTQAAVLHGLLSTLEHKPYLEMPMSTLYLYGRPQDMSYARASALSVAADRNHLRCWQAPFTIDGVPLWVGAATHDIGFERDERNGKVTHKIAPEIDVERDYLRDSFLGSGAATAAAYFTPEHPLYTATTATGGSFSTDGRVLLLQLR